MPYLPKLTELQIHYCRNLESVNAITKFAPNLKRLVVTRSANLTHYEAINDISEGDDPAKVLGDYICAKVDLAIQYPSASKIFALEIIQGAPNLQEHLRTNLRTWVREKSKIIQSWIDQGKMKAIDPEHLIFMIWSTTQHYADFDTQILTVTNKLEYDEEDVKRIKDLLCTVILGGCGLTYS